MGVILSPISTHSTGVQNGTANEKRIYWFPMKKASSAVILAAPAVEPRDSKLKSWALVELFGHQRIVGWVSEQTFGTGVLFRVDVPDLLKDGKKIRDGFTRYIGLSAIYSITPMDEQTVRALLPSIDGTPAARPMVQSSYSRSNDWEG